MKPQNISSTGRIKWGYAFNQWKIGWQGFARVDDHIRALKITSACGFRRVELSAGTGPWDPTGRPESIAQNFGSVRMFGLQLGDWGIDGIPSIFFDPAQFSFEEGHFGLSTTVRADHAGILAQVEIHVRALAELGGDRLVVQPFPSYWKQGALNLETLESGADCLNAIAKMARGFGVRTVLHLDALSALRTTDELDQLLALCPAELIGLAFDTAELTIAGHDVVQLYRRYHERVQHFHFKDALAVDTLGEYRLPHADRALMLAGGSREIPRWFGELGSGLVDFEALVLAMKELGFEGWIIVESDKGPQPVASSVMLNSWYVQNRLLKLLV